MKDLFEIVMGIAMLPITLFMELFTSTKKEEGAKDVPKFKL